MGRRPQKEDSYTNIWILKNDTNELIYKTKRNSQTWKANLWLPKGNIERNKLGVWD